AMVLAGSTSAGSLMWSAHARAGPSSENTNAAKSRRVRMDRPSTDFLAYSSEDLQVTVRSERDVVLRVARAVYAVAAGTRSLWGQVSTLPRRGGQGRNLPPPWRGLSPGDPSV